MRKNHALKKWRGFVRNRQVRWLVMLSLLLVFIGVVIGGVESRMNAGFGRLSDSLYWAVVTLASVGYGDITPESLPGRLLTIPFIIIGVVLMSYMTATIASILTASRIREGRGLQKIDFERHVVVCGFNTHLDRVIDGIIAAAGRSIPDIVLVNSRTDSDNIAFVERFPAASIRFVSGDYTAEAALLRAAVDRASSAIILAEAGPDGQGKPDDRTLIAALAIKALSRQVEVCAELLDSANEVHLRRAGVDQIVYSGEFSGFLLSSSVMTPGIAQALREIMRTSGGNPIRRAAFPREMTGRSFAEAARDFLDRDGTILLGVITERRGFNMEDILVGDSDSIDDFIRRKFAEAGRNLETESKGRLTVTMNPGREYRITDRDYAVVLAPAGKEDSL